jgi:hypothetical protein
MTNRPGAVPWALPDGGAIPPVENAGDTVPLGEQEEYIQAIVDAAAEMGASFALPNVAAVGDESTVSLTERMQNISMEVDEGDDTMLPSLESQTAVLSSEQYSLSESNNKRVLLSICAGLGVGDWNSEPYASATGKLLFKLSATNKRRPALLLPSSKTKISIVEIAKLKATQQLQPHQPPLRHECQEVWLRLQPQALLTHQWPLVSNMPHSSCIYYCDCSCIL